MKLSLLIFFLTQLIIAQTTRVHEPCHPSSSLNGFHPKNCLEIKKLHNFIPTPPFLYKIYPSGSKGLAIDVHCDFHTFGGGWTLIQSRGVGGEGAGSEFYRDWSDYEKGFGCPSQSHWIGLKNIAEMTSQDHMELHVTLTDWDGTRRWANYDHFFISSSDDQYRLSVSGYTGNGGDALGYHDGWRFSTKDRDHDGFEGKNCAEKYPGGWWYKTCYLANLNGFYWNETEAVPPGDGIQWQTWKGFNSSLKMATMQIRPVTFEQICTNILLQY